MPRPQNELSIKGKNGERIAVKDCKIEPLNFLLPGGAPILVPKNKTWPKSQKKKPSPSADMNANTKVQVTMPASDEEDAGTGYEGDRDDERQEDTSPLIKKKTTTRATPKKKTTKCEKQSSSPHKHAADKRKHTHEQDQQRLQERIDKQQAYIGRLKAKYEARAVQATKKTAASTTTAAEETNPSQQGMKNNNKKKTDNSSDAETPNTINGNGSSSEADASARNVREMIRHLKIKAAGTNNNSNTTTSDQGGEQQEPFTPSEDIQLLVRKKANESWKDIVAAMGRSKKQLQKRFKELQEQGVKAPDSDEDDEKDKGTAAETTTETGGDTTTTGGAETTTDDDGNDGDAQNQKKEESGDGGTGDVLDVGALFGALEAIAEDTAGEKQVGTSPPKDNEKKTEKKPPAQSPAKPHSNKKNNKKKEKQAKVQDPKKDDADPTTIKPIIVDDNNDNDNAEATAATDDDDDGIKAYIATYARDLLAEATAGRVQIPKPDENFDQDHCLLLALTALHRRQTHWLAIQADFANITGRLVPEDVLKEKLFGETP